MLEKSILTFIDCHTTPGCEGDLQPALSCLATEEAYNEKQHHLRESNGESYVSATTRRGQIINELRAGYELSDFWKWYIPHHSIHALWEAAWKSFIPLEATLRIKPTLDSTVKTPIDINVRVYLFPYGWSVRVEVTLTGQHSLAECATVTGELLNDQRITFDGETIGLHQLLGEISTKICADAFCGNDTIEFVGPDIGKVASVAAADGAGVLNKDALSTDDENSIGTILRPSGGDLNIQFLSLWKKNAANNFIAMDGPASFIYLRRWFPSDREAQEKGVCYHNNNVRALIFYLQRLRLLYVMVGMKRENQPISEPLLALARSCIDELGTPNYVSAGVRKLLELPDNKKILEAAQKEFP